MNQRSMFHLAAAALAMTPVRKRAAIPSGQTLPGRKTIGDYAVDDDWQSDYWIMSPEAQFGHDDALS